MSGRNLSIVILVLILILGGWWYLRSTRNQAAPAPSVTTEPTPSSSTASPSAMSQKQVTVTISSTGFNPSGVTIPVGGTVTWTNQDSAPHTVNSDPHPTHTLYPPLNSVGQLQPGESKSLSFPTAGVYKYHDHLNPQFRGSVTVQ